MSISADIEVEVNCAKDLGVDVKGVLDPEEQGAYGIEEIFALVGAMSDYILDLQAEIKGKI